MQTDLLQAFGPHIILDGAMGTELERRGYPTTLPLWSAMANLEAPVLVKQIHDDYIAAGADIITANTFRTTSYIFSKVGKGELAPHLTRLAVEIARESAVQSGRHVLVAGSLAPLEDCYSPELVPNEDVIREAYTEQIDLLISAGVDFILAETMINLGEIKCISAILKEKGFPLMMSFTTRDGHLLDGTPLESAIFNWQACPDVSKVDPLALMLNCRSCEEITQTLPLLQTLFHGMTGAYANGPGRPDPELGWHLEEGAVDQYLDSVKEWIGLGARIVGGCCGTTPEHISRISRELRVY